MPPSPVELHRQIELDAPVEVIWPLLASNSRANRTAGIQPLKITPYEGPDGVPCAKVSSRRGPLTLHWREPPNEWEEYRFFAQHVFFERAPVREYQLRMELVPLEGGRTRLELHARYVPAVFPLGLFGGAMIKSFLVGKTRWLEEVLARRKSGAVDPFDPEQERPQVRKAALARAATLAGPETPAALVEKLVSWIERAPEPSLARMRPLELARVWNADPDELLALFLRATRVGLLTLRWELLCPDCRAAKSVTERLADVRGQSHCESCAIVFGADFARHIEATFSPAPEVRDLGDVGESCVANPGGKPHVVLQRLLAPGKHTLQVSLREGLHQLRPLGRPERFRVQVTPDGPSSLSLRLPVSGTPEGPERRIVPGPATLEVEVEGERPRLFRLERMSWADDAATAAKVTSLQQFRDLFPEEAIAAGEQIQVSHLGFLFTDLKGSTSLYERVGDGPAYGSVRDHFEVIQRCVTAEAGAVVKTVGDAVMGVFPSGAAAMRSAIALQRAMQDFNKGRPGREPVIVKAGVHAGPCLVVRANDRLDYFGTTVNTAARLQGQSVGHEIVLDAALAAEPEVRASLQGLRTERYESPLSGLSKTFELVRVWPLERADTPAIAAAAGG